MGNCCTRVKQSIGNAETAIRSLTGTEYQELRRYPMELFILVQGIYLSHLYLNWICEGQIAKGLAHLVVWISITALVIYWQSCRVVYIMEARAHVAYRDSAGKPRHKSVRSSTVTPPIHASQTPANSGSKSTNATTKTNCARQMECTSTVAATTTPTSVASPTRALAATTDRMAVILTHDGSSSDGGSTDDSERDATEYTDS